MFHLAAAVLLAAMISAVKAQTAEETVAYMAYGLEAPSKWDDFRALIEKPKNSWVMMSVGLDGGRKAYIGNLSLQELMPKLNVVEQITRITKLDECRFRVTFESKEEPDDREHLLDFRGVREVAFSQSGTTTFMTFVGATKVRKSMFDRNLNPLPRLTEFLEDQIVFFYSPPDANRRIRLERASEHFRATSCRGRAF